MSVLIDRQDLSAFRRLVCTLGELLVRWAGRRHGISIHAVESTDAAEVHRRGLIRRQAQIRRDAMITRVTAAPYRSVR